MKRLSTLLAVTDALAAPPLSFISHIQHLPHEGGVSLTLARPVPCEPAVRAACANCVMGNGKLDQARDQLPKKEQKPAQKPKQKSEYTAAHGPGQERTP